MPVRIRGRGTDSETRPNSEFAHPHASPLTGKKSGWHENERIER